MNILGINQVSGLLTGNHDSAAALIVDGKLVAFAEEERFNRVRHAKGMPHQAIAYCLKEGGLRLEDIDVIALGYNPFAVLKRGFFFLNVWSMFTYVGNYFVYKAGLRKLQIVSGARVIYIDHHLAHAATAYRCAGWDTCNVITIDGAGETETAALYEGRSGVLTRIAEIPFARRFDTHPWRSIGKTYTELTNVLGLGAHGEGKTMGLASYGTARFDMSNIMHVDSFRHWCIDRRGIKAQYGQFARIEGNTPISQEHKDLAASLQAALEDTFIALGKDAFDRTGIRNFGLAGGVALNCNGNSKLLEQEFCDALFVQPASNDAGAALGAALEAMHIVGDGNFVDFQHAYWGPGYSDDAIEAVLIGTKMPYHRSSNIAEDTAKHIAAGKIVGWFQGRMEAGPRALGGRSILANPCIKGMNDRINEDVKHREVWRPFAPSITTEDAHVYFDGVEKPGAQPYMLQTFYVKKEYRDMLPAITHVDGSSRIQTVKREQNAPYYDLLKAIEKHTGFPIVLNTSFNDKGEPIVCSPQDALRCFFSTGIDVLAIGNFLINKGDFSL